MILFKLGIFSDREVDVGLFSQRGLGGLTTNDLSKETVFTYGLEGLDGKTGFIRFEDLAGNNLLTGLTGFN